MPLSSRAFNSRSLLSRKALVYQLCLAIDSQILSGRCIRGACGGIRTANGGFQSSAAGTSKSLHHCRLDRTEVHRNTDRGEKGELTDSSSSVQHRL